MKSHYVELVGGPLDGAFIGSIHERKDTQYQRNINGIVYVWTFDGEVYRLEKSYRPAREHDDCGAFDVGRPQSD